MDQIPDSVFGFILQNLKELIVYNYQIISGAKGNYNELCKCIDTLNGFVKEYTKKRYQDNDFLKSLTDEIRDVVHEAEDTVETYIHSVSLHNCRHGIVDRVWHEPGDFFSSWRVAEKVANLRDKAHTSFQEIVPAGLGAALIDQLAQGLQRNEEDFSVVEAKIVGLDNESKCVIDLLKYELKQVETYKESEQLPVISITGMFGLGKTTLAKKILKDPRIHDSFPDRAFVKVSQDYDKRKVFLSILDTFTEITNEMKGMTDDRLAKEVKKQLETRKYLIVLDDVWSKEAWDALQGAFPIQKDSVILITSRDVNVAYHANPLGQPYQMLLPTLEDSKDLLRKKTGLKRSDSDNDLEKYLSNIAEKCEKLPLSIVVIAGILQPRRERIDIWERVSQSVNAYVAKDPKPTGLIRLSYDILPFHLKQCLIYLGVFREGSEIPVWKLLRLWIAEGFVQPNGDMSLEDIAEDYLEELLSRNLVMVSQRKSNGQIKTCLVHDALRTFCKNEATNEKLFQEIKGVDDATALNPSWASYRRLYINPDILGYNFSKHSLENVRSFLSFAKEEMPFPPENVSSIAKGFKLLRVLDVKSIIFPSFPDELISLVLLKYIAIACKTNILPEEMSNLLNLQTFIFETSFPTLKVMADILKMSHLRHLHTKASLLLSFLLRKKDQNQSSKSEKLQTLCTISPQCCRVEVFKRVPNLKRLGIRGKIYMLLESKGQSCLFADISEHLQQVQILKLINEDTNSRLNDLFDAGSFPRNLTRLTLKNTRLNWERMTTLEKLNLLQVLKLKDNAFQGAKWEAKDGGFPHLRVLYIGATNLKKWECSERYFPTLKCLILRDCSALGAIPSALGEKTGLQKIDLYDPNVSLTNSAIKIEEQKLEKEETRGFKLSVYYRQGQPNSVTSSNAVVMDNEIEDILRIEDGGTSNITSGRFSPEQRPNLQQSVESNTNAQKKRGLIKGFLGGLKKVKEKLLDN